MRYEILDVRHEGLKRKAESVKLIQSCFGHLFYSKTFAAIKNSELRTQNSKLSCR
jgi:hypothetical protein